MATTTKKTTTKPSEVKETAPKIDVDNSALALENEDLKKKNDEMMDKLNALQLMMDKFASEKQSQVQVIDSTSKFDKVCTLIHLIECPRDLPTSIVVNGQPHFFSNFGEKRAFRFADMQAITTKYRDWFNRGIFTLGSDCDEFVLDFGLDTIANPIPTEIYRKIETLNLSEFKSLVESIEISQKVYLAKTWIQRYNDKRPGYENIEKMRVLNKATQGLLKDILTTVAVDE